MKIALIGAYNLADGYLGAAKALERLGHEIEFVPAYRYKTEHGKEHFSKLIDKLKEIEPEVCLWWRAETLNGIEFLRARKLIPGKFIMFSWDDPLQWEKHPEMPVKSKLLDSAFTCCMGSVAEYKKHGCENAVYCPPGFDPEIHKPEISQKHACDISIVCTNMYGSKSITDYKHISRLKLLACLIKNLPKADIRVYGPESFKDMFEDRYKGWVAFDESRKVFHNSKINLCTHVRPDGNMYLNERVGQILGSKGLLYVDPVDGFGDIIDTTKECVVMDFTCESNLIGQVKNILSKNESYDSIRENGYKKALSRLTWDSWAKTISDNISD